MIFIDNKYTSCYKRIIATAQSRNLSKTTYFEKHHIVPKSIGGEDCISNLVRLTGREHFICHLLLTRMVAGDALQKMNLAVWLMCNTRNGFIISSTVYNSYRMKHSENQKIRMAGNQLNKGRIPWNLGVPRTTAEKQAMSVNRRITAARVGAWNVGLKHSDATVAKITEKARSRISKVCEHCEKQVSPANYARWHGTNCRRINQP